MLTIKNIATKVESQISEAKWNKVKNSPIWKGVFEEIKPPPAPEKPPEVVELETKMRENPEQISTGTRRRKAGETTEKPADI